MGYSIEKYYENMPDKSGKNESFKIIIKYLEDIEKFFESDCVIQTRKQRFGFHKSEQFEISMNIQELKEKIEDISKGDAKITESNNMMHILGNSIPMLAEITAIKFEHGDFFSNDNENKLFPVKRFEQIKEQMELILFYIKELKDNQDLIKEEIDSNIGYSKHFVEFLCCDLPTQTPEQLKLFKFFRQLKNDEINKENFFEASTDVKKYLNIEELRKSFPEIVPNTN